MAGSVDCSRPGWARWRLVGPVGPAWVKVGFERGSWFGWATTDGSDLGALQLDTGWSLDLNGSRLGVRGWLGSEMDLGPRPEWVTVGGSPSTAWPGRFGWARGQSRPEWTPGSVLLDAWVRNGGARGLLAA